MNQSVETPCALELSTEDLQLIQASLRLFLVVEDDKTAVGQLKELLTRVDCEAGSATSFIALDPR
jgi:hypothetical protein